MVNTNHPNHGGIHQLILEKIVSILLKNQKNISKKIIVKFANQISIYLKKELTVNFVVDQFVIVAHKEKDQILNYHQNLLNVVIIVLINKFLIK